METWKGHVCLRDKSGDFLPFHLPKATSRQKSNWTSPQLQHPSLWLRDSLLCGWLVSFSLAMPVFVSSSDITAWYTWTTELWVCQMHHLTKLLTGSKAGSSPLFLPTRSEVLQILPHLNLLRKDVRFAEFVAVEKNIQLDNMRTIIHTTSLTWLRWDTAILIFKW